jgi:hypothetical protein
MLGQTALGSPPLRDDINFNRSWKFRLGDVAGAESSDFDDAGWDDANLPHSFSIPYFLSDKFYVGYGWYRKRFDVPAAWSGQRINLEFDGVFQVAELFVNGNRVGEHKGGYTGFTFDITGAVRPGANIVAVRVNNLWDARLTPRAGEHVFSGGIYRNVRLVITAPLHVAWYGTFVTTPQVSRESGTVNVKTEVVNDSAAAKAASVRTQVVDPQGKVVAEMGSSQMIAPGATEVFDQTSTPIPNPKLWSPTNPNLYAVKTTVLDGDRAVDDYTSPLGFRWLQFTADRGFFLNGEHYYFKGANVHQDHAGWGDAVTDSGMFRDVKFVKDAGFDFIRGSHYPHAPGFALACDRLGILFWSENCFWGTGGHGADGYWTSSAYPINPADEADFQASVKASLRDMIRIHRNHPSIIIWSMDNEVFFSDQSVMPKVRTFLKELVAYSHELDPTRPAAIGGCQRGDIDKLGDVAGYNGDGARLFGDPGIANVVSEYGCTIADRPASYDPGWGDLPSTPGADPKEVYSWRLPWRSGESLWCAFDHGSIFGHFGAMGMLDYFRLPKRQWYWYRNEYRHIPPPAWPVDGVPTGLKLTADKTTLDEADGTDDAQIVVTVVDKDGTPLSNCPPVTLSIDSGPGEFPTGPSITFAPGSDIVIRDGQAAIEFRSYDAGKTIIRASSPGLKDATLEIISHGEHAFVVGKPRIVKPRPYVRFTGQRVSESTTIFGRANPTRVSSEAPDHPGRFANDGDPTTFWQAADGDAEPWLSIDLERIVNVSGVKLTFPAPGNWRYRIDLSPDCKTDWKPLADQTRTSNTDPVRTIAVEGSPVHGRFLRVTIVGSPANSRAALSEMEATGALRQ